MTIARLPALVSFLVCQARASVSVAVRVSHHYVFCHALELYLYNLLYSYACTALWGLVIDGMRFINVICYYYYYYYYCGADILIFFHIQIHATKPRLNGNIAWSRFCIVIVIAYRESDKDGHRWCGLAHQTQILLVAQSSECGFKS